MISNYEIRNIKNEEILYIYISDDYEFSNINKGKKRKNFLRQISDFIDKNEIKFAGSTIALVAGGLIIGNLFLNKSDDINLKNCIISLHLNPQVEFTEVLTEEFFQSTSFNTNITNENNFKENSKNNDLIKDNNTKDNKTDKIIIKKDKIEGNNTVLDKENVENSNTNVKKENVEENNKEIVTVFRSNGDILNLELEKYLINVVAAEMPASFNIEALKAQSVLARTYTKKAIKAGKVLTDTTSTQVYKDNDELKKIWENNYSKYYEKIKNAVMLTAGEVLKYNDEYIEAVYHSTSNGFTENAINVWGNSFPYLKVVESHLDKNVKKYKVNTLYTYSEISSALGFNVDESTEFNIISRNSSNRVSSVSVNDNTYTGIIFREILGLRSADFEFEKTENGLNIITYGYGHGVGMSQYGANEMAKNGSSYKDILKHYYSGTNLVSL